MIELILVIAGLLAVSFTCSILESVILSTTRPYIQSIVESNSRIGKMLMNMKNNIEEPIAAILTLNTISHTVGAAISGAMAMKIFGSEWMALFSAVLTFLILILSEIIPKTVGALYWRQLSYPAALVLKVIIFILKPVIVPVNWTSRLFSGKNMNRLVSRGEIVNYVRFGYREGVINSSEMAILENLFNLQAVRVKEIMTPRPVVFWLPSEIRVGDLIKKNIRLEFSRIPVYNRKENRVEGIVLRRELINAIQEKKRSKTIMELSRKPYFIPESISVFQLLNELVRKRTHMAIVVNEYGDFSGAATLEDAMESLIGAEIVDEFDTVADMRSLIEKKDRLKPDGKDKSK